jgi:hypothetical protein
MADEPADGQTGTVLLDAADTTVEFPTDVDEPALVLPAATRGILAGWSLSRPRSSRPKSGAELVVQGWSSPASIRGPSAFQADALPTELLDRGGRRRTIPTERWRSRRDLNPRPPA